MSVSRTLQSLNEMSSNAVFSLPLSDLMIHKHFFEPEPSTLPKTFSPVYRNSRFTDVPAMTSTLIITLRLNITVEFRGRVEPPERKG